MSTDGSEVLEGDWLPMAADISGRELDVAMLRVARLSIRGAGYSIVDQSEQVVDSGTCVVSPDAAPAAMDLIGTSGPNLGKRIPAIYECRGSRLLICYDLENPDRPASMQPAEDQLLLRITYVRAGARPLDS